MDLYTTCNPIIRSVVNKFKALAQFSNAILCSLKIAKHFSGKRYTILEQEVYRFSEKRIIFLRKVALLDYENWTFAILYYILFNIDP